MMLSIIIPSFNTQTHTLNCLKSVYQETKNIKFEIIVVDNASKDGSVKVIKKKFPQVKLIVNDKNLGFAKANNQALRQAQGEYILFLNSDTLILDQAIKKSLEFMVGRDNVDILGCQLLNEDKTIQSSGGFLPRLRNIFYMMFFIDDIGFINRFLKPYQESHSFFYKKTRKLGWVTGAFLLVKKEVVDKIGSFDEDFFMYGEEIDFCIRAWKTGFNCWFYAGTKVIHLKGKSSENAFEKAVLGEYQALKKIFKKHKPGWEMFFLRLLLKTGAVLRLVLFGILKQDKSKRKVYEKAFKLA